MGLFLILAFVVLTFLKLMIVQTNFIKKNSMTVKELIDYINSNEFYSLWDMEASLHYVLKEFPKKVIENLETDEYGWYTISTTVYKLEDGFVGVRGVSNIIYIEGKDVKDYCVKCSASEYIEIPFFLYKKK